MEHEQDARPYIMGEDKPPTEIELFMEEYFKNHPSIPSKREFDKAKQEFKNQQLKKVSIMSVQLNIPVNGKVKSVTGAGSFTNEHGTFNSYEYTMEDGMVLKANHKDTTQPWAEGSEVEYTITRQHPDHGNSGKVGKQQNPTQAGGGSNVDTPKQNLPRVADPTQKSIETQKCLDIANQYHIAHGFTTAETHKELCDTARLFYAEMFSN